MVKLNDLLKNTNILKTSSDDNIEISGISYDSRKIEKGSLFIAIKGYKSDGHKFIKNAIANGAVAVVIEDEAFCSNEYPWVLASNTRIALSDISAEFYNYPSEKFVLIGVTGTNGKTTTTNLIASILEKQGKKVGLIGTIHTRIDNTILPVERTTPESADLQALFARMLQSGVTHVIMEVSSHALDLQRVRNCYFDVVVFTNLTQDHLDYHNSMEEYFNAKAKLFLQDKKLDKKSVINADDVWGKRLIKETSLEKITYSLEEPSDLQANDITISAAGVSYKLGNNHINLELTGKFNVYNSLAALGAVKVCGVPITEAVKALKHITGIPGRFETLKSKSDFAVIVDYAHTPDSLINILSTAQEFVQGRIITVFGCGGDRDRTKRPLMGQAAAENSDYVFITSDNPRTEKPEEIINDILPGVQKIKHNSEYQVIVDRYEAIKTAIKSAQKDDIVIIAGKGHETYQEINHQKFPFDDKKVAEEILQELGENKS